MQSTENIGGGETFIPHERFFTITVCLVIGTLIFGVLFPNGKFERDSVMHLSLTLQRTRYNVDYKARCLFGLRRK